MAHVLRMVLICAAAMTLALALFARWLQQAGSPASAQTALALRAAPPAGDAETMVALDFSRAGGSGLPRINRGGSPPFEASSRAD